MTQDNKPGLEDLTKKTELNRVEIPEIKLLARVGALFIAGGIAMGLHQCANKPIGEGRAEQPAQYRIVPHDYQPPVDAAPRDGQYALDARAGYGVSDLDAGVN
ncbi:hypothetical protein COV20_01530 [Candidatus Woesearchaeota archaeon CG10_big_fil_rev_8_21_14_0_10_45_16]|nr:MAG: hypothetical protein COV20_01530 [Candidatus Woesearchaeota archaeon CG10_big_fil_rev_8_21_14_0_10_45_16]